jgi:hypothetical protein
MLGDVADDMLALYGRQMTLRKTVVAAGAQSWKPGAATSSDTQVQGRWRFYKPQEIIGTILQGDSLFVVSKAAIPAPAEGDMISPDGTKWWRIMNVYAPEEGTSVAVYRCQCRR